MLILLTLVILIAPPLAVQWRGGPLHALFGAAAAGYIVVLVLVWMTTSATGLYAWSSPSDAQGPNFITVPPFGTATTPLLMAAFFLLFLGLSRRRELRFARLAAAAFWTLHLSGLILLVSPLLAAPMLRVRVGAGQINDLQIVEAAASLVAFLYVLAAIALIYAALLTRPSPQNEI